MGGVPGSLFVAKRCLRTPPIASTGAHHHGHDDPHRDEAIGGEIPGDVGAEGGDGHRLIGVAGDPQERFDEEERGKGSEKGESRQPTNDHRHEAAP